MQLVEYYLKKLLFDYDCVTIPGLGGFIMQLQPARIIQSKKRINPPSRHPSFNSLLNHDDGLLISTIARDKHISYRDAGSTVSDFTANCKRKISSGENVILEGIGVLSSGPDGGIHFRQLNQTNFFAGAFGMEAITIYPVARQMPQTRLLQKPQDRKPQRVKAKHAAAVTWTLMLSVPVILFLLYGIIFPSSLQNLYTNYSGIVFDIGYPKGVWQPVVLEVVTLPDTPELKTPASVPVEKPVFVVEPVIPKSPRYFIIGGCFENEQNAGKFLANLISKGFEAEKAGTNNRGYVRISYKSFSDKASALPYLKQIRDGENASAWLLKY